MTDFSRTRDLFHLPDGVIYLDGNSLGPLPKTALARATRTMADEWGEMLIGGWNKAQWMAMPGQIGNRIARLIGAEEGSVVIGDTLSIKVYQALASALDLRPDRRIVLSDSGNFPTDLYMAEGLLRTLDKGHELKIVAPEDVASAIDETVAAVMLTHVDYGTGRMHDIAEITRLTHEAGAISIWDLAHSAGSGGPRRLRRRFRDGLHLQISQWRAGRTGLHLCSSRLAGERKAGPFRLARP